MESLEHFSPHECLSRSSVERDLVGDNKRNLELSPIIFDEMRHRSILKLSLGERVVIYTGDMESQETEQLVAIAAGQGAAVIIEEVGMKPTNVPMIETIKAKWQGITVIGDVHGDHNLLVEALAWAHFRQHFVWLLGDIIDYGADSLQTMTTVYEKVMGGEAAMILGNHERKIAKWLDQKDGAKNLRLSEGNKVTIDAYLKLNPSGRRQWGGKFRSLLAHASLITQMFNIVLVHAAAHPSLWTEQPDDGAIEQYALYGESDQSNGKFKRIYRWVDQVPSNKTVFVGHDVLHTYPMVKTGAAGGQIVFLDTGCGKGGHLSSADLRFTTEGLRLECFKRY